MTRVLKWTGWTVVIALVAGVASWVTSMPPKAARGVWQTDGYGLVVEISPLKIDVYQVSNVHCSRDMRIPAHLQLVDFLEGARFEVNGARLEIAADGTLNPIFADRISALPDICTQETPSDAQTVFDIVWDVMNTHYAHFDTHGINWAEGRALRPDGPLDDAALFEVLQTALTGLDDGHTYIATSETVWSPSIPPAWHESRHAVRDTTLAVVPDISEPNSFGLQAGWAAPGIGYIYMAHMSPDTGIGQRSADAARDAFAQLADHYAQADGLILDVRYNPGGSDDVAMTYAGFFTETPVTAFTKTTRTDTGMTAPYTATVAPQGIMIKTPVVLLTGPYTGSAAEIFTLAMREMPQVTVMGTPTSGGLSDIHSVSLPNGWELGLSHQVYLTPNGDAYERVGIPPDVPLSVDVPAALSGRDTILEAAIAHLTSDQ